MGVLAEEQWELDGVAVFGGPLPSTLLESGLDYGAAGIRTQDASRSGADGFMFGRDYVDGPEMTFTIGVQDTSDVWPKVAALMAAWRPSSRLNPGQFSTLRYMRNGVSYRMFGRPRKIAISPGKHANNEFQILTATFQLAEAILYRESNQGANTATLTLRPSTATGGLIFPVKFPVLFGSGSLSRANGVSINAVTASPFTVTVKAPVTGSLTGIALSGQGWSLATSASLAGSDVLVIDTRAQTVQKNGQNVPGTLSASSTLNARLTPGAQVLSFIGNDPSNTATATFSWFDAIPL